MQRGVLLAIVLGAMTPVRAASASPLFDLAGGVDGPGGLQAWNVAGGASAAYFNPALLTKAPFGVSAGFLVIAQEIGVSLAPRPSAEYNVPTSVLSGLTPVNDVNGLVPLPTSLLPPRQSMGTGHQVIAYETIGGVLKLFDDRLALGIWTMVPDGNFTSLDAFYSDEREQYLSNSLHPELYGDRLSAVSIGFGVGYELSESLSVGLGGSLSLAAAVGAPTYVSSISNLQNLTLDTDAKVNVSASPDVGVSFDPTTRLHLSGSIHAPEKVAFGINFSFLLPTPPTPKAQSSQITLVYDYMPWQFAGGVTYDIVQNPEETLTLAGTAVLGTWSAYVDRHGNGAIPAYAWYDTITPTGGVRYRRGATSFFFDAQYKPSPVPLQTGRTNYVDNDRLGAGTGVDYAFTFMHTPVRVGFQTEMYWLLPRDQTKLAVPPGSSDGLDHYPALVLNEVPTGATANGMPVGGSGLRTNNPGWPGFGSEGAIIEGGLYIAVTP